MVMQASEAKPGGAVIPSSLDTFEAWAKFGVAHGWISSMVCETHDSVPLTEDEHARVQAGGDPCVWVVRVWE